MRATLIVLTLLLLCSCSPRIVTVTEYKERYHTLYERDSVHVKDSVNTDTYIKGDTVFRDKIQYRYIYWSKSKNDTVIQRDSIPYPVEVYKEVNVLTWWQQTQIKMFWTLLSALLLWVGWRKRKVLFKLL